MKSTESYTLVAPLARHPDAQRRALLPILNDEGTAGEATPGAMPPTISEGFEAPAGSVANSTKTDG